MFCKLQTLLSIHIFYDLENFNKFQFTFSLHNILFLGSLVYPSSPAVEEMGEKKGNFYFSHFQQFINALKIQVE